MKIGIDCGHTLVAPDTGAYGCLGREENRTREIGNMVISKLKSLGHTVINCTTDKASTVTESLAYRVNKANSNNVDIFVSIHLNAFNKSAHGTEVYVSPNASQKSKDLGAKVVKELAKLGFVNRGVNANNLYVCNHTNMPAILVECCFVDSLTDMKLYNADKIAAAIVLGITGQTATPSTAPASAKEFKVRVDISDLRIRSGAGTSYKEVGFIPKSIYTIVETKSANGYTWGKLKSGAGWIALEYTKRV